MKVSISCLNVNNAALYSHWGIGPQIHITDGWWFNNSQVDYLLTGGNCGNGLKNGTSSFYVHYADSYKSWDFGYYMTDGFGFNVTQLAYLIVGGSNIYGVRCGISFFHVTNVASDIAWDIGIIIMKKNFLLSIL